MKYFGGQPSHKSGLVFGVLLLFAGLLWSIDKAMAGQWAEIAIAITMLIALFVLVMFAAEM